MITRQYFPEVVRVNIVLSIECLLVGCQQIMLKRIIMLKRFRMIVVIIELYIGAILGDSWNHHIKVPKALWVHFTQDEKDIWLSFSVDTQTLILSCSANELPSNKVRARHLPCHLLCVNIYSVTRHQNRRRSFNQRPINQQSRVLTNNVLPYYCEIGRLVWHGWGAWRGNQPR